MNDPRLRFGAQRAEDAVAHESAALHVSGRARYCDDEPEPAGLLHAAIGCASLAHARIDSVDLDAVRRTAGVRAVLTATDIRGENNYGSVVHDDPILADGLVHYEGQPLFLVVADTMRTARIAARRAQVRATPLPAILDLDAAIAAESWVLPPVTVRRGDAAAVIAAAPHRASGRAVTGAQDHFYLEGQIAIAAPRDDGGMHVRISTQHPSEVQLMVAAALGTDSARVQVECRRMGGGFGGKETQPALLGCLAAIAAQRLGVPVKLRLDRDDDMIVTGKRHPFRADYTVGFDADGRILGLVLTLASDCGYSADLSGPVNDRALAHVDNAYFLPNVEIRNLRCRTNKVSATAFRGFGGPQGMFAIEHAIAAIARTLRIDPLDVRRANLYGGAGRDTTHYGQTVRDNVLPQILDQLVASSEYAARRESIRHFNAGSGTVKRGIALTPVKFGISFNSPHLNQAGALLHLYTDGSLLINHGGTEMGQGLFTKVAQVVARAFDLPPDRVAVSGTDTARVPNTSATAASSGSDLNGMAALDACATLQQRLAQWLFARHGAVLDSIAWRAGGVEWFAGGVRCAMTLRELARAAHLDRVSLSAQGYYRTPDIHWDGAAFSGAPFYYFAYGAAVSEVAIDVLTGEHRLLRVDIVHDVGTSLNEAIDIGQIEGGFVQGAGWLTSEEVVWDRDGRLATHAPSTYKIPTAGDVAPVFNVRLLTGQPNPSPTIHRSKAVGEPPLMLALSVYHALLDAVQAAVDPAIGPAAPAAAPVAATAAAPVAATAAAPVAPIDLQAPCTPESVLRALGRCGVAAASG